jgi:hypothetical protein
MADHRQRLAGALAAELPGAAPGRIEHALDAADSELGDAYARGERPRFASGLPAVLGAASGISDERLAAAFESMSRHARERRWAERS